MVIAHAFLALAAGFATMALLVILVTAALSRLVPEWVGAEGRPGPAYAFVNLGYSFLAAAAGGYVTTWIAGENMLAHIVTLAIVVLALTALSALQMRGRQPVWYQLMLIAIAPLGVVGGGLLRLKVLGTL
jgi:hypothetical protein